MTQSNDSRLPPDLDEFGESLRDKRPQASPLELDRIKTRAMMQGPRSASLRTKGTLVKSRLVGVLVASLVVIGGTGGVLAATGGVPGSGGSSGSAPNNQYCPPSSNNPGAVKHIGNSCGKQH